MGHNNACIPASWRQEAHEFKAILGYISRNPVLKGKINKKYNYCLVQPSKEHKSLYLLMPYLFSSILSQKQLSSPFPTQPVLSTLLYVEMKVNLFANKLILCLKTPMGTLDCKSRLEGCPSAQ